jgi:hypothetical protein
MTSKVLSFHHLVGMFLLMTLINAGSLHASSSADAKSAQAPAAVRAIDVTGTWSGTFFPKHTNVAPFSMTVVISQDEAGNFIGDSSLDSNCLKGVQLKVTVRGAKVDLAGSDEEGHNITLHGTLDNTGTQLKSTYILNGSATGNCESEGGSGNLAKR